ncbi:putative MFS family arabinose efflux permease [Paenibacillus sp. DS2015]
MERIILTFLIPVTAVGAVVAANIGIAGGSAIGGVVARHSGLIFLPVV